MRTALVGQVLGVSALSFGIVWSSMSGCTGSDTDSRTESSGSGTLSSGPGATGSGGSIGSSGITTGINTTTSSGSGGTTVIEADAACGQSKEGNIPIDVLILLDKSGSMTCLATDDLCETGMGTPSRWDAVSSAINAFCTSPGATAKGVGVGLTYFGIQNNTTTTCTTCDCNFGDYATPHVPILPLPGNASAIATSIAMTKPSGDTTTVPALQGALKYAKEYMAQQMDKRFAAVLLVSDGLPRGCGSFNTPEGAAQVASDAFMGTPSVATYVVGMGDVAALDAIAIAGSGGAQHYIPAMGDVPAAIIKALQQITGRFSCAYTIPRVAGQTVDPSKVHVQIIIGPGGMRQTISRVDSAAQCTSSGGWYYDNPASPTKILLCRQTCDALNADPSNNSVDVLYGCATPPR